MFACIGARENSARRGTGSEKKLAQVLVLALVCAVVVTFGLLGTDIFQGSFPGEIPDGIARIVTVFWGIRGSVPLPVERTSEQLCGS